MLKVLNIIYYIDKIMYIYRGFVVIQIIFEFKMFFMEVINM